MSDRNHILKNNRINVLRDVEKYLENPQDFPDITKALTLNWIGMDEGKISMMVSQEQDWPFFHAQAVIKILKTFE